jgi:flagellar hook-associated protein 2
MNHVTAHRETSLARFSKKNARLIVGALVPIVPLWKIPLRIMATSTSAINVSSITGGTYGSFDWQTMVTELIQADSAPVTALQAKETTNQSQITALSTLQTDFTQLQTDIQALTIPSLFTSRTVSTSDPSWNATAASGTAAGTYSIAITHLATAASRVGSQNIASPLSSSSNVEGLTLATLPTATPITAGTFTVNGQPVTIALTDSLQDVFDKIYTATGGAVTASYVPGSDKIKLTNTNPANTSEIVLGAVNDSSNFLQATQLANNGTTTVISANPLGAVGLDVPLAQANLSSSITAVDGSGNGSFTINGVSIAYNINTDSLATVMSRINASSAGVTASYNPATNNVILANNSTGDIGLGANDVATSGQVGLLGALGLTSASTLQHGQNALFTVNGGPAISSASNTLSATTLGITGLTVTAGTPTTQTITVAPDTTSMTNAIQAFVTDYNTVQSAISTDTTITTGSNGQPQTAVLSSDQDVAGWASQLESLIFATVPGLSGTVTQLANLGLDFDSTGQLSLANSSKLQDALTNHGADVAAYFTQSSTGIANSVNSYLDTLLSPTGALAQKNSTLVSTDNDINTQITTLQAQLTQEQANLTTEFEAMQAAQTTAQSQLNYLNAVANLQKAGG